MRKKDLEKLEKLRSERLIRNECPSCGIPLIQTEVKTIERGKGKDLIEESRECPDNHFYNIRVYEKGKRNG